MNRNTIYLFVLVFLIAIFKFNYALAAPAVLPFAAFSGSVENLSVVDPCDLVQSIDIFDPEGDASAGSPSWVDILGVQFRQLGSETHIRWKAATTELTNDDMLFANGQGFRLFFDTDHNNETGQQHKGIGAELKITLGDYHGRASLHDFDGPGNWIGETLIPIAFLGDGFALTLSEGTIPSTDFRLLFESTGNWVDQGGPVDVILDATPASGELRISSPGIVLESGPHLMNLTNPSIPLPLTTSLFIDDVETILDPSQVTYRISHPVDWAIPNPESIVSIDSDGIAHYVSAGYVFATAAVNDCAISSDEYLLATGDVYGDPTSDDVIAVFPTDYIPDSSTHSFGDMMSGYPDMMRFINTAYSVTSGMYGGFRPFGGDKQILSPLVADVCGMPGNPMATAPCCYMNCGDASPQYGVIIHEMGHNFAASKGMQQLLWSDQGQIANSGFSECVASLPVIFFEGEISLNGVAYDFHPDSFEYTYSKGNRDYFCPESQRGLTEFEQLITDGLSEGIFDNKSLFDGVQVFCSFFEAFSCDYIDGENSYKHHMIPRFLNIFNNTDLPAFVPEKVETYFAAAYSVAAGRDMRTKLRFWGFTIDDTYYEQILPFIKLKVREDVIFQSGFE